VEFANRPMLGGEPLSDIAGTIAMQDAINLLWAYLFVAADYASMPARVVMGQEPPKMPILDENGQKIGEKPVDIERSWPGPDAVADRPEHEDRLSGTRRSSTCSPSVINVAVKHVASADEDADPLHRRRARQRQRRDPDRPPSAAGLPADGAGPDEGPRGPEVLRRRSTALRSSSAATAVPCSG
jgi:hypothetical protein